VQMNTTNGHHVYKGEVERPMTGDIVIGRHVWIGSWANIAKGTRIADDSLVSQCSVVSGSHPRPHTLIAGNPASDISQEYRWRG
jgi:acetyltransferase-like isoleucine patch superfamily enzyme